MENGSKYSCLAANAHDYEKPIPYKLDRKYLLTFDASAKFVE